MNRRSRIQGVWLALLPSFLLFALLTLTLTAQSLWWDEGISLHLAALSWAEIIADRAANIHPPLYFFALKLWASLTGFTPFATRYFSVLGATLLPALGFAFFRSRVGTRTARLTAWLLALAPPFFIYGQEVRAYAWLPPLWLMLLAQVWPEPSRAPLRTPGAAIRLGLTQAALVMAHYAGGIAVAWANVVLLAELLRRRDGRLWRRWAVAASISLFPMVLWAGAVLHAGMAGLHEAGMGNALATPIPARYLWQLIAIFHVTGLPTALADPLLWRPAALLGGVMSLAVLASLRERMPRRLLMIWLVPLTMALPIWHLSPQAHPRYLLPFVLGGWLTLAYGMTSEAVPRVLRRMLLAVTLAVAVVSVWAYLTEPRYARSDVRGVAVYLRRQAQAGDTVLVPHTDWSLPQYDLGAAVWRMMPAPGDDHAVAEVLSRVPTSTTLYLLDYRRGALDPRGEVRSLLAWRGVPLTTERFNGVLLQRYEIDAPPVSPACRALSSTTVGQDALTLVGAVWDAHPQSGAALPVQLCWRGAATAEWAAVALRLYAPSGALIASRDDLLLDAAARPSEQWAAGPITTYHVLPLPVGLLPRPFRLELGVYRVADPAQPLPLTVAGRPPLAALPLGWVTPTLSPWWNESPYGLPDAPLSPTLTLLPGLRLTGAAPDRSEAAPGQTVYFTMRGVAVTAVGVPPLSLCLRQGSVTLTRASLLGLTLPAGRPWREVLALHVPPDAASGPASVDLCLPTRTVPLAHLTLRGEAHTFDLPPVAVPLHVVADDLVSLRGCDAPSGTVHVGEPLTVTLVWQAGAHPAARDLTVFTHLVGEDGAIVAQHDGIPQAGRRPFSGWLPGEVIVDRHVLTWQRSYSGTAVLRVGLYDPSTGERIPWQGVGDAVPLPLRLTVQP